MTNRALRWQVEDLAVILCRLRKRLTDDVYGTHLIDQAAGVVEVLDAMLEPTAAEIYRVNFLHCLDNELSATAALEDVDRREQHLRRLLGREATV